MLGVYDPMRKHFEAQLGRRVEFYTAANFAALMANAKTPDQPFTLMPMHLALVAVEDWGAQLVARSTLEVEVQLWAPRERVGTGAGLEAVRGKRVAVIEPMSLVTMLFYRWRAAQGLDTSVRAQVYPSLNSALLALSRGDVDLVNGAQSQLREAAGANPVDLVSLIRISSLLTPGFVAHPGTPASDVAAFRRALLSYRAVPVHGSASEAVFVEGSVADLRPYAPFAAAARTLLADENKR